MRSGLHGLPTKPIPRRPHTNSGFVLNSADADFVCIRVGEQVTPVVEQLRTWLLQHRFQMPPILHDFDEAREQRRRAGVEQRRSPSVLSP